MPGLATAKELREKRANLASRMNEIMEATSDEGMTSEQREEFDRLHERQESLAADIQRIERAESLSVEMQANQGTRAGQQDRGPEQREREQRETPEAPSQEAVNNAFEAYIRHGASSLTPEQRSIMGARYSDMSREQRALSAGTDASGGYTVPEGFYGQLQEAMLAFGGMRRAGATIVTTDSGNPLPIPTDNDTSNKGARLSENTQVSEQDITFGAATLNAYMYTSKLVRVSIQLLEDSAFDIGGYLSRKLGMRLGRITNQEFTTGTGSSQPEGVVTGAALGVTASAVDTFTWDELVDLQHSVDPDYREMGGRWMFADAALKVAKKLKDGEGRPIWVPGVALGQPDTILGDPYLVNQDVADPATSAKSVLYGDFSNYFIRDVRGVQLMRLSERYADYLQVGFIAFSRHDGQLVDAGTNPIKYLQHS